MLEARLVAKEIAMLAGKPYEDRLANTHQVIKLRQGRRKRGGRKVCGFSQAI